MNKQLIDDLTNDLKPVCPCCPYSMAARFATVAIAGGAFLLTLIGLRPDLGHSWLTLVPYWKSGIFLALGAGSLLTLCRLGLPGRGVGLVGPALMTLGVSGLFGFTMGALAFSNTPHSMFEEMNLEGSLSCLISVSGLGVILMAAGSLILRRMAFTQQNLAGALLGASSGAFAAAAYAWHCINDQPFYVDAWYTIPVAGLTLLGFGLGRHLFRL